MKKERENELKTLYLNYTGQVLGQKGHLDMGGLLLKTIAFVENYYYETFSLLCLSAVISHKNNC